MPYCSYGAPCFDLLRTILLLPWFWTFRRAFTAIGIGAIALLELPLLIDSVGGVLRTYRLGKILNAQRERMHTSASTAVVGYKDPGFQNPINVVLVLGESTRAASMHCYGFALPTTPKLDELRSRGEIAVFTDVVSPSNATIASTQAMLTFYTNEQDKEQWHEYPDLVSVMNTEVSPRHG